MHHRRILQLWIVFALLVGTGTITTSTPAACTGAHCVYLPLVSTPEIVSISNVRFQTNRFSEYVAVVGEVRAISSTPVYSITLEVRLSYDGRIFKTIRGSPILFTTLPGQPNPFLFSIGLDSKQSFLLYDIRVVDYRLTSPQTYLPIAIDATSASCEDHKNFRVEGTITNQHDQPLENVIGVVWDTSIPYGFSPQQFAARLEPFQTVPFSTSIRVEDCDPFGIPPAYQIAAQGVVP